jgi:L-methionine (R)-S-oxide reductase
VYQISYNDLIKQLPHILEGETNFISNCSNFSSLLFNSLNQINWVGFYFVSGEELLLGPFQGNPACTRIKIGKGVCGTSAMKLETIVVDDVHLFPGHIACDANSKSEIVIPIIINNNLIGVLDIDSPITKRFESIDKTNIEALLNQLISLTNFSNISKCYEV